MRARWPARGDETRWHAGGELSRSTRSDALAAALTAPAPTLAHSEHMDATFGQLLSVHPGSYQAYDDDKALVASLHASACPLRRCSSIVDCSAPLPPALRLAARALDVPPSQSMLSKPDPFKRQRGSSKPLWHTQQEHLAALGRASE